MTGFLAINRSMPLALEAPHRALQRRRSRCPQHLLPHSAAATLQRCVCIVLLVPSRSWWLPSWRNRCTSFSQCQSAPPWLPRRRQWEPWRSWLTADRPIASSKLSPADAEDSVPLPRSSEAVTTVALLRRYCSAIEGRGLVLAECSVTVEQAITGYETSSKEQATLTQFFSPQWMIISRKCSDQWWSAGW